MLRCQGIHQVRRVLDPADHHRRTMRPPARGRDPATVEPQELRLDRRHHPLGEATVVGDQDRLSTLVMLGLREQVGGDPIRVDHGLGHD